MGKTVYLITEFIERLFLRMTEDNQNSKSIWNLFGKLFDATFLRFILVGVINTVVGASTMFLLFNLAKFSYWTSSVANYIVGGICSFLLNKYFTYRARASKDATLVEKIGLTAAQAVKFTMSVVFSFLTAYYFSRLLINIALPMYSDKIRDNIAMLCGTCGYSMINYFLTRFWVFRK